MRIAATSPMTTVLVRWRWVLYLILLLLVLALIRVAPPLPTRHATVPTVASDPALDD
jgi:hypothetical protein